MEAIDHLDLVVTSLERSLSFYAGLLQPLATFTSGRSRASAASAWSTSAATAEADR